MTAMTRLADAETKRIHRDMRAPPNLPCRALVTPSPNGPQRDQIDRAVPALPRPAKLCLVLCCPACLAGTDRAVTDADKYYLDLDTMRCLACHDLPRADLPLDAWPCLTCLVLPSRVTTTHDQPAKPQLSAMSGVA
jgi:hypothetical protein